MLSVCIDISAKLLSVDIGFEKILFRVEFQKRNDYYIYYYNSKSSNI